MENICRSIIEYVKSVNVHEPIVIAIDGRCGSGKSTLADMLASEYDAPVVRMDHFFLRPEQRTDERFSLPGGNSDRDRLLEEVLLPMRGSGGFEYGVYRCDTGEVRDRIHVPQSDVYIIEGTYSCHPEIWDYCDLHVFLMVETEEQIRRITRREGDRAAEVFRSRWIPMEEKYFNTLGIIDRCELVFDTTNKETRK